MEKVLTKTQQTATANALEKLISMPQVKDLIRDLVLVHKRIAAQESYSLILKKNGVLVKNHYYIVSGFDEVGDKVHEEKDDNEKITKEKFIEVITFFDLDVEQINSIQKRLQ